MLGEIVAAVTAQAGVQRSVRFQCVQRLRELFVALVVQTGGTADALSLQDVAPTIGQHRPPQRPRFECDHREALKIRRHDQQIGRRNAVELVLVWLKAEVMDPGVLRDLHDRRANQDKIQASRKRRRVAQKKVEQLLAALVFVDASDIDGEWLPDVVLAAKSFGIGSRRDLGTDTHHDRRHLLVVRGGLNHRAFFMRVVHDRAHTSERRSEDPESYR